MTSWYEKPASHIRGRIRTALKMVRSQYKNHELEGLIIDPRHDLAPALELWPNPADDTQPWRTMYTRCRVTMKFNTATIYNLKGTTTGAQCRCNPIFTSITLKYLDPATRSKFPINHLETFFIRYTVEQRNIKTKKFPST